MLLGRNSNYISAKVDTSLIKISLEGREDAEKLSSY
jgi:hypothetical protein